MSRKGMMIMDVHPAIYPKTTDELMAIIRCAIDNYAPKWEKGKRFELHIKAGVDDIPVVTINGEYGILPNQWRSEADIEVKTNEVETNIYDVVEEHHNCFVQILRNTVTGEVSFGWRKENEDEGDTF